MYSQLNEHLTENETKYTPLSIDDRLKDLYKDNKRAYVKCQCGCFVISGVRVRPDYIGYSFIATFIIHLHQNMTRVISSSMTTETIVITVNQTLMKL